MKELPIADCFKEYYRQHNTTFTDSERATIFWQSVLSLPDKLAALREIMETTADTELKKQIQNRLTIEEKTIEVFMNCDSRYIHLVTLDDQRIHSIFHSLYTAVSYGKENCCKTFRIHKELPEDAVVSTEEGRLLLYGTAEFRNDGIMIDCACHFSEESSFVLNNDIEPTGFEEAYITVLNPFEYGDIVRIIGDNCPAVMLVSRERWEASREHQRKSVFPMNYDSNSITVEFLYPDGTFSHGHPNILSLEKIEKWDDEREWKLLQSVSELMKGHGSIERIVGRYEANRFYKN